MEKVKELINKLNKEQKVAGIVLIIVIVVIVGLMLARGSGKSSQTQTFDVESEVRKKIESYVAVDLKLNASINTQAHCYSVTIDGDTATVYGNYTAIGSSTKLGTFKGTCKVEVSNDKVYISNEKIDITKP